MQDNVKNLLVLILLLLIIRWACRHYFLTLWDLIDPVSIVVFLFGCWEFVIKPLIK